MRVCVRACERVRVSAGTKDRERERFSLGKKLSWCKQGKFFSDARSSSSSSSSSSSLSSSYARVGF